MSWQSAYDGDLQRALKATWEAESRLGRIGANERKEEAIDELRLELRAISERVMDVWKAHYGPQGRGEDVERLR
jgi:hypothetical protein